MSDHTALGARAQLERAMTAGLLAGITPRDDLVDPRHSAVLVLFGKRADRAHVADQDTTPFDLDLLLEVRADTLRNHPGEVSFPGGATDPTDADATATALREAQEETGLTPDAVDVIAQLDEIPLVAGNFLVAPVIGWRNREVPLCPMDEAETREVRLVPVADLLDPARRFTAVLRHDRGTFRGPAWDLGGATLWGFTAMVTNALLDACGWSAPWDQSVERDILRLR